jgi:hypothetical protein
LKRTAQRVKPLDQLTQGHARLKLNLVLGHRSILLREFVEDRAPGAGSATNPPAELRR